MFELLKQKLYKIIVRHSFGRLQIHGRYRFTVTKAGTKQFLYRTAWINNLVVNGADTGIQLIAQHLAADTTNPLAINTASIGTGSTAPSASDTDLETAVLEDISVATQVQAGSVVNTDFFITDAQLANGTYEEFGIFCTGKLFARSLIVPAFTKASGEDVTINYQITLSVI